MDYSDFLTSKRLVVRPAGIEPDRAQINPMLFDFQRDLVQWALRKGRCALFADTGLGKTFMQLEWARLMGGRVLIIAPLSIGAQTVKEARKLGIAVHQTRSGADTQDGINITNYEMIEHFNAADFGAVVLDESSILKGIDGKTRTLLTEMFRATPYKLCCTATPAPNDIAEIANHAEFLGVMSRVEMLATFFTHDDGGWYLKAHGREPFYRWLASWGMSIRRPSDLGYSDAGYLLPALDVQPVWVATDYRPEGQLLFTGLKGIGDRTKIRKATKQARVAKAAEIITADADQWVAWCGLNDEQDTLAAALGGDCVSIAGATPFDEKIRLLGLWLSGERRVLVTKASVLGFGMNFQNAHKVAFVGLGDSWEQYYQCIRRCYRFGQEFPVEVRIVLSEVEQGIFQNVLRKEEEARQMGDQLIEHVRQYEEQELAAGAVRDPYETGEASGSDWRLLLGDSTERIKELTADSVDLSIFSPPFQALYTYSASERDLGNCKSAGEFYEHFGFIVDNLLRVTKPGRNCCVHVAQVPAMLVKDGYIGLKDFRGDVIRLFEGRGWIFHGEVCIDKDPQAQAIRTHAKALLFNQFHRDSSWSRPAMADYILIFRKPGDNAVPVHPDVTNTEWIEWARPIWYNIKETDTLQYGVAREADDERHICPLQLGTIERCVRLWSNPGETVLDPFNGIGSTGYTALKKGRRYIGIELKRGYWDVARKYLAQAVIERDQPTLFDFAAATQEDLVPV